jgi:competence protein ComEC
MQNSRPLYLALLSLFLLVALTAMLYFYFYARADHPNELKVVFLDVGQGDAIFIETPSGRQVLIDGGPTRSVLSALSREMSFFDRSIDIVLATHPDRDHIGGLVDVFRRYDVDLFIKTNAESDTPDAQALARAVQKENAGQLNALAGQRIQLDEESTLTILFPDRPLAGVESNLGSIIVRLDHGNNSFLFTGDAPKSIEEYVTDRYGDLVDVDVLKVGHHGSRTSSAEKFLQVVSPEFAIISAGRDNSYGHPHREVLDLLSDSRAEILETAERGSIRCISTKESLRCGG